jgi:hypothetical protein
VKNTKKLYRFPNYPTLQVHSQLAMGPSHIVLRAPVVVTQSILSNRSKPLQSSVTRKYAFKCIYSHVNICILEYENAENGPLSLEHNTSRGALTPAPPDRNPTRTRPGVGVERGPGPRAHGKLFIKNAHSMRRRVVPL